MLGVDRILVVVDQNEAATVVLEKAVALAKAADAELEVIHVVYEGIADIPVQDVDHNQVIKTYALQAAEAWLEDQLDSVRSKVKKLTSAAIWNKDEWLGVVHAAEVGGANLIIKAADRNDDGLSIRTPQDWNLLRHSDVPVMLVKANAWVKGPIIMAAIDALNDDQAALNQRVLQEADNLTSILGGELAIVATYPLMEPWAEPAIGIDFARLKDEIEQSARKGVEKLTEAAGVSYNYLYIEEGRPAMRIRAMVEETNAEMLVMGTVGRTGVKSFVIGNTSETILHYTDCDVVVLR
ncbi:MAG: universal stress protein [Pseudomonadales bacterium]|nr:universal stress protein [Pseudomonadales bacterium]